MSSQLPTTASLTAILAFLCAALFTLPAAALNADSFYKTQINSLQGTPFPLADLKGKTVLFVNTASKCGFTRQYDGLEKLWQNYKDKNFVIIGVPSNNFGKQEPGSNAEIANFCRINYGVSFPMLEKIDVKGKQQHPLYAYLTKATGKEQPIKWNFTKILVGPEGQVLQQFGSRVEPSAPKLIKAIDTSLGL